MGLNYYNADEWRLFIHSSKQSLKSVLLHNGNGHAAVPIGHSVTMSEKYNEIKTVIELLDYNKHNWIICIDLKMVNFLLGQQSGYTKFPCFLCGIATQGINTGILKCWPPREKLVIGEHNVVNEPLVDPGKIVFPPLHIKLGS